MYDYFFMQLLHHIPRDKQTYTINDGSFLSDAAVSTSSARQSCCSFYSLQINFLLREWLCY